MNYLFSTEKSINSDKHAVSKMLMQTEENTYRKEKDQSDS